MFDFTMMCFFVYACMRRYNASIFNFGIFSGGKVNLVGTLDMSN